MIKNIVVEVNARTETGKNACRRLRYAGQVPGIVYGLNRPPFWVAVNPRKLEEILRLETGRNTIFKLALAGEDRTRAVMIKDLQRDPVSDLMVHVDFVRVDLERAVRVNVPVRLIGTAVGVKTEAGIVEFITRQVEVECLPQDIPEHLDLDVTALHINQHASVSALTAGEKVRIHADPEAIVVVIAPPRAEEVATPAEEAAPAAATAAEPEVIKKGKEAAGETPGAKEKDREKEKK